jgi:hypothetical protein
MPVLDRQAAPASSAAAPTSPAARRQDRVAETAPTPLQRQYINLSAVALVAGAIAITAIELGSPISSPLVKLCVLVAAPILVLTTGDAALRIWRSAWAWMPTDRGRGLFRLVWFAAAILGIGVMLGVAFVVLPA